MTQTTVELPHADLFERALAADLGEAKSAEIVHAAAARYGELYAERTHYANRALRRHLEESLLPGIALYQALSADPQAGDHALPHFEAVLEAWGLSRRKSLEFVGRLPIFYWLMRATVKTMTGRDYPPEGWDIEWLEVSRDEIRFDISRCFYMDVLAEYGVPELARPYCRVDDLIYDGISPYASWERKRTLGRGDDCCDFRFVRVRGKRSRE
jgi:hypothetical protein